MSISIEQQNLLDDLRAPVKSFKIFALEEVIRNGGSPEVLSVLEDIALTETDPECSMLISHAIAAIKESLSGQQAQSVEITDSSSFVNNWRQADDNQRMSIITNLPARLPKDIRAIGPELLSDSSPVVSARVIRAFCRNWPKDKFDLILEKIYSESLVLKLAALKTIVHMDPERLLGDLPTLLASPDPQIKALAIRALVKIDQEEAVNHLQALLLSPTESDRLAGIQNCPFLPYDMVKPLLLKCFAAETNPDLLTKAGWIIEMNPDVEVPFSLFEISERCAPKKAALVKNVLNESVKLLEKSGILGDGFLAYTKKLQTWVNKRNALRFVKQAIARLDKEDVSPEVDKNILSAIRQSVICETFKESLQWPVSELVKSRVAAYLERVGVVPAVAVSQPVAPKPVETQNVASEQKQKVSQLEIFASMTEANAKARLPFTLTLLAHKKTENDIKVAIFHCLTRYKLSGGEEVAQENINNKDVALATAAVEYLGAVDPDRIFPYIGQCLKVPDIGMKSVALGILKNYDYNQAISSLKAMLNSSDQGQQKMALECMNQFDFALVRDMLTEYLSCDLSEDLLEAGLCHFAANPSAENVYCLYKIEQAHTGKIAEQAKALREACPAPTEESISEITSNEPATADESAETVTAQPDPEANKKKKEEELKERLRAEKEKKKSKRPAYAYQNVAEQQTVTSKEQLMGILEVVKTFVASKALPISVVGLIAAIWFIWVMFFPSGGDASGGKGGAVVATPRTVEGQVSKILDGVVTLTTTKKEQIIMLPAQEGFQVPTIGQKLRVSITPYRRSDDGETVVRIRGIRVIENYSPEYGDAK